MGKECLYRAVPSDPYAGSALCGHFYEQRDNSGNNIRSDGGSYVLGLVRELFASYVNANSVLLNDKVEKYKIREIKRQIEYKYNKTVK